MRTDSPKDHATADLLRRLELTRHDWVTVDDWNGDLASVGLASSTDVRRVVYVSTFDMPSGRYYYECDMRAGNDPAADTTTERGEVDFEGLFAVLKRHLSS